ncbi:MAG: hypothetical protein U0K68_14410 [Agathobacter sp.]|nr:hypothetical protein [Agathobacter sp.]
MKKDNLEKVMEYLMDEIHTEWERTGAVKQYITITPENVDDVTVKVKAAIYNLNILQEEKEMSFKQSMKKSKECYILLRLVKKIIRQDDLAKDGEIQGNLVIGLDKEELKLYKKILKGKE